MSGKTPVVWYYDYTWRTSLAVLAKTDVNATQYDVKSYPIVLKKGEDPNTQSIGFLKIIETLDANMVNDNFIVFFNEAAGGGTITFSDNNPSNISKWQPNTTHVFGITGGSKDYTNAEGFVVVETDDLSGRNFFAYFN